MISRAHMALYCHVALDHGLGIEGAIRGHIIMPADKQPLTFLHRDLHDRGIEHHPGTLGRYSHGAVPRVEDAPDSNPRPRRLRKVKTVTPGSNHDGAGNHYSWCTCVSCVRCES